METDKIYDCSAVASPESKIWPKLYEEDKERLIDAGFDYYEGMWCAVERLRPFVSKDEYTLLEALKLVQALEKLKEM